MSASIACDVAKSNQNTGVECSAALGTDNTHILIPRGTRWAQSDVDTAGSWMEFFESKLHANGVSRWFALGNSASFKISDIQDSTQDATYETLPDGTETFLKGAIYNRTYVSLKGGFCLAEKLIAMSTDWDLVIIDDIRQFGVKKYSNGDFSGIPIQSFKGLDPTPANYTAAYKNRWKISMTAADYVSATVYKLDEDEDIALLKGLVDAEVTESATPNTTGYIYFGAQTQCAGTDLVERLGSALTQSGVFIVEKVSDGSTPAITVTIQNGELRAAGTFSSGADYTVEFAPSATLYTKDIIGYDGVAKLTTSIP